MPTGYDPYRTPPLWIEPKEPLDYVHDEQSRCDHDKDHGSHDDGFDDRPESPIREPAHEFSNSSHLGRSMKFIFDLLIPPINASREAVRRWHMAISLAVVACSVSIPVMFGAVPVIPFSGFAYASDVKDIKVRLLEREIFDSLVRQCGAKNDESRQFYAQKVQDLLTEYRKIADASYQKPTCRELTGSGPVAPQQ